MQNLSKHVTSKQCACVVSYCIFSQRFRLQNFAVRRHPAGNEGEEGAAPGLKADDVVLIDFGLSRKYDLRSVNEKEYFSGTREYASERQLLDKPLGPADDVESLGYALLDLWRGEQWW